MYIGILTNFLLPSFLLILFLNRIGQTQAVVVKRLIMKSSIEEQILEMQQKKLELVQTAIGNKNVSGEPIGIVQKLKYY